MWCDSSHITGLPHLMEPSKKILYVSTAYFMRSLHTHACMAMCVLLRVSLRFIVALGCLSTSNRKSFHHAICGKTSAFFILHHRVTITAVATMTAIAVSLRCHSIVDYSGIPNFSQLNLFICNELHALCFQEIQNKFSFFAATFKHCLRCWSNQRWWQQKMKLQRIILSHTHTEWCSVTHAHVKGIFKTCGIWNASKFSMILRKNGALINSWVQI